MCGIAGFLNLSTHQSRQELEIQAKAMGDAILHRGPDAGGVWVDPSAGIGFAHRRLSIIDLSEAGAQPMTSSCGRYVICYNGEVYNFPEVRQELEQKGHNFRGHSDTEVILESCARIGVKNTVERLIGMFAFALWDKQDETLFLVRDRLGIKPLYWSQTNSGFLFGSELKSMHAHASFQTDINYDAVASYLRYTYVPTPISIFEGTNKLQQGQILTLKKHQSPVIESYWSLEEVVKHGSANPFQGSDEDAIDHLEQLLKDCVKRRMVADVPLGTFLSGGIDSSLVTSLMQAQSAKPIKSFSIGFHDAAYNEAELAAEIAKHLGTEHTELYVTPEQVREIIPNLSNIYDEPFADSSQLPTWMVSHMTKQHVTVALSGDGGDELFGGYTRYSLAKKYSKIIYSQPRFLRQLEASVIKSFSPRTLNLLTKIVPESKRPTLIGDKLHKLAGVLGGNKDDFYRHLVSHWKHPNELSVNGREIKTLLDDKSIRGLLPDYVDRMMYLDTLTYMHDDILTKVDRASMDVALEVRVPLLDHRLAEFAWTIPQHMKIRNGQGKWILRQVLNRYVPNELYERPKMGFGVPVGTWLRGPLKEWAGDLLSTSNIKKHGLVNPEYVEKRWNEHLSGDRNWESGLWSILMLQSWAERWIKK